jgi:hypothetical protein
LCRREVREVTEAGLILTANEEIWLHSAGRNDRSRR